MARYKNLSGSSGIVAHEIGPDFTRVQFADGAIYLCNHAITGSHYVENMKQLAKMARDLTHSSIQLFVRHTLEKSVNLIYRLSQLRPNQALQAKS